MGSQESSLGQASRGRGEGIYTVGLAPVCPSIGPSLTGLLSGGAGLTTPTDVKAATELMMVGMMLNLPACRHKTKVSGQRTSFQNWPLNECCSSGLKH